MNLHDTGSNLGTMHAESKAIHNLKVSDNIKSKRLEKVNLLVIRVSPYGKLGNSKPCLNCINNLNNYPIKKGYIIDKISYSTIDETIEHTTLKKLNIDVLNGNYHISKFYRNKNYNI